MTPTKEGIQESAHLSLFEGYGVELEYMIVDRDSLNVLPITDKLMFTVAGSYVSEIHRGEISWSNELALHLIELKTTDPSKTLLPLPSLFQAHVQHLNRLLKHFNAMLMPTAMHPWMDPHQELKLWPHQQNVIYETFNKIFDCRGHGWANLQSCHLNISFANDEEFARLHAAIRILLPLLPALAASSPFIEGKLTHIMDNRLHSYLHNCKIIPSITGKVIPEKVSSRKEYEEVILNKMYRDIAPHDPHKVLQHEWLNARGAIARFDRYSIEIRLLDTQECPIADIAICDAIVYVLKALVAGKWKDPAQMADFPLDPLYHLFLGCMKDGEEALIHYKPYLEIFGCTEDKTFRAGQLWEKILADVLPSSAPFSTTQALEVILSRGPLARRIQKAWTPSPDVAHLKEIYQQLCECLDAGKMFIPE